MRIFSAFQAIFVAIFLLFGCDSVQEKQPENKQTENQQVDGEATGEKKLSAMEKLAELSKAAVVIRVYSIVEGESLKPTILPDAKVTIYHLETKKKYQAQANNNNLNVFLDLPPGTYRIEELRYDDPLTFAMAGWLFYKLDDKKIIIKHPKKKEADPLLFEVNPRKLQYGGDYSVMFSRQGHRAAPPDFENEPADMKKASELILAQFPHSRWAKEALKILGIDDSY